MARVVERKRWEGEWWEVVVVVASPPSPPSRARKQVYPAVALTRSAARSLWDSTFLQQLRCCLRRSAISRDTFMRAEARAARRGGRAEMMVGERKGLCWKGVTSVWEGEKEVGGVILEARNMRRGGA